MRGGEGILQSAWQCANTDASVISEDCAIARCHVINKSVQCKAD